MSNDIRIRLARETDLPALVEFNQAMARETEGKELDSETLAAGVAAVFRDSNLGFYVVAESGSEVVAGLMVTFEWSDWRNGQFWWIQSVYVRAEHRGRGLYRMLYDQVKTLAAERGNVRGFRLYVEKDNVNAQRVYEKLGMAETHYKMYEE